jgi:hypothetical protein
MENLSGTKLNLARLSTGLYRDGEPASPGLELVDPRLDAINDAAFKSKYEEAAGLAQAVWDEGARDVRVIGYLLYGYYLQADARALAPVFEQLTLTLSTQWDRIGPARKDKQADGALHWLFSSLIRQLDGHEKARDEQYQGWLRPEGAAAFAAAEAAADALVAEVEKRFADGKCFDKLRNLSGRIREISSVLRAAAEPHAAHGAPDRAATEATRREPADGKAESDTGRPSEDRRANAFTVEGGAALGLLLRKLRLFEQLVAQDSSEDQTVKAAVIARDVEQLLGAFDPAAYFPKLFVPYFRAMTRCADQLAQVMAELEMPRHKSLVQLYHADFDAFAES